MDINYSFVFDESHPIIEVKIEENFILPDVLDIVDEKHNCDDSFDQRSCDEHEGTPVPLEARSKPCNRTENVLIPVEPESKYCNRNEIPIHLKPRSMKKTSKFKLDIRKEGTYSLSTVFFT